ncbi:hypothetical protein [Frankia sp. EAN1pec]|uniref:hypothetical protein n=1 Tax=Parafrankia sp. (strain EAN1pec) TaxID=298653 RepID=UPI00005408FF
MSLLSAPTWLLVALLVLLVIILIGPERTYQRAVGLLQAFRGNGPDGQVAPASGDGPAAPRPRGSDGSASEDEMMMLAAVLDTGRQT